MKKLWKKFKDWLIDKLGGYTKEDLGILYKSQVAARRSMLQAYENAVQEICRRNDNSYYNWCCEYCGVPCDRRDGWCERFTPKEGAQL